MEQQGLRQADLAELVGSRGQVPDILSGRRGISKAVARRLAERFDVGIDLFLPWIVCGRAPDANAGKHPSTSIE
jgi:HTH-type transcriptional regulator/antitoxin HigA